MAANHAGKKVPYILFYLGNTETNDEPDKISLQEDFQSHQQNQISWSNDRPIVPTRQDKTRYHDTNESDHPDKVRNLGYMADNPTN
jgi:acid phosphatase class B